MSKPRVLILGGISTFACPLTEWLVPGAGEPKVSFLRIVDKVSVLPATCYIPPTFLSCLKRTDLIEYRQANLQILATVSSVFDPPADSDFPFDIVYDLSGEKAYDRPEIIHMTHTCALAAILGAEAQRRKVKAYVRIQYPWYEMKGSEKKGYSETAKLVPDGERGMWWHEAVRSLAGLKDLNLVILRIGAEYGPSNIPGVVLPRIVCGHIYKFLKEPMKLLHSADLKIHTIHVEDVCLALTLASDWMANKVGGRAGAEKIAGVEWGPSGVGKEKLEGLAKDGVVQSDVKGVSVPLFNIVDSGSTTQEIISKAVSTFFGIKHDYYGGVTALFAKLAMKQDQFKDMVDDANEMHIEAWAEMLSLSSPPIENSPLTPYLDQHEFQKNAINLNGRRAREVLGFEPKHKMGVKEVERIVRGFQEQGLWPTSP